MMALACPGFFSSCRTVKILAHGTGDAAVSRGLKTVVEIACSLQREPESLAEITGRRMRP
jgi:hypothetical protein